ncbi:unnamed protein product [Spirodela intermedia]|uniref:Uncharacterized protein n=1 Tax=Spirodela intermedia TaxID=51605 RepID=A0A7I8JK77_SPIIN|nr:unnamed protein product [Spirodela intermedia]CAA6670548.1 unnamed protein product [Spirodela intermedia]
MHLIIYLLSLFLLNKCEAIL